MEAVKQGSAAVGLKVKPLIKLPLTTASVTMSYRARLHAFRYYPPILHVQNLRYHSISIFPVPLALTDQKQADYPAASI